MEKTLKKEVESWLSAYNEEERKGMLEDLQSHGCVSGMVSGLIYYSDTVPFFKEYKKEIIELVENFCVNTGETLKDFLTHANNFPLNKQEIENESFVTGIDGLMKKNRDIDYLIMNWFAWFGFEETAYNYYIEKYENSEILS